MWPGQEAESFILAVGYHGAAYSGSQIQPDMPTVQGEIKAIIEELNWSENAKIRLSSRTDAGVSARMNLIDLELVREATFIRWTLKLVSGTNLPRLRSS